MLYLIKSGTYLKIEYTYNVEKRMTQYATHNPDFILLDTAEGSLRDEENLHAILKPYWIKNEWFYNCDEVIKVWNSYKNNPIMKRCETRIEQGILYSYEEQRKDLMLKELPKYIIELPNGDRIIDLRDKIGCKRKIGSAIKQKLIFVNRYIKYLVNQEILIQSNLYPKGVYIYNVDSN